MSVEVDKKPRLIRATLPPPYNILDIPEGQSVEFTINKIEEGEMEREVYYRGRRVTETRPLLRVYFPVGEFLFGAPYLDLFSQRAIMAIKSITAAYGVGTRVRLTAVGVEPSKHYSVEIIEVPKKE